MRSTQFIMDIDKANCYQWYEFYVNQNECYVSKKTFQNRDKNLLKLRLNNTDILWENTKLLLIVLAICDMLCQKKFL